MDRSRVAVVIPAYNEAETIGEVVTAIIAHGLPIVVDDGSS
ncbi:MAG: glycosyltransferase, partial [Chloroflexia bacterium]|nr:glycosyltransferase [Chloroflexia bacterium]